MRYSNDCHLIRVLTVCHYPFEEARINGLKVQIVVYTFI